ncbi:MAG: hypothetical protein JRI58_07085 [Deltaproteobacteria bacterium]|nr:hypothetical protein [Deltaproteobacteria bacterium]MBW2074496.1 hypothetical protein [Deltaproteobacteria bacterium]
MRKRSIIPTGFVVIVLGAFLFACATVPTPTEQNFKTPVVTLNSVELAHYWGWWYFSKKVQPTKGKAGDYGAPLDFAFIFDIENPNPYPVMMEHLKFTVAFEEFDLNTVSSMETQWIPAGKTNQVRVHAMFDGRQSLLSLLVTGGFKLKEKGMGVGAGGAFKQLEAWWVGAPEFSFPIYVKEGSAVFKADGLTSVVTFSGTFPQE